MKSFLSVIVFLSLLLFADTIAAARKDGGEYWRAVMKDQPMPEALQGLVGIEAAASSSNDESNCHDKPATFKLKEEKIIVEDFEGARPKKSTFAADFEPRPSTTAYGDDANLKGKKKSSSFADDFEPRPSTTAYGDDANLKGKKKSSSFADDFEPRPSTTAYGDDANLKGKKKSSSFANDFEPRPSTTAYGDDANLKGKKKSSSFADDFEPRPSVTAYGGDDAGLKGDIKSFASEFEQEPNVLVYHD